MYMFKIDKDVSLEKWEEKRGMERKSTFLFLVLYNFSTYIDSLIPFLTEKFIVVPFFSP